MGFLTKAICTILILISPLSHADADYNPLDHLWSGTKDIFKSDNTLIFAAGSGATLISLAFDHSLKNYFAGHNRLGGSEFVGNDYLGTGAVGVTIGVATLAYGLFEHHTKSLHAGEAHLEALFANLVYSSGLKLVVQRERPDGNDHYSFPSGHVSTIFCTTGVLMEFYGGWVGYPMAALGVFTGVARMASNRHWLSDVVFGATLGYIVGRSYSQHHLRALKDAGTSASILPYYENGEGGLTATWIF